MDFEADPTARESIQQFLVTRNMVHASASSSWTLYRLEWTSTNIRNQSCTRIQISFFFRANFGYEFSRSQSIRMAIIPQLHIDPSETIRQGEISQQNNRKRAIDSPSESVCPAKKRRGTQTEVQKVHLDRVPSKYTEFILFET